MKLDLHVTTTDGDDYTVQTNLFVIVAWERKYKRKASDLAAGDRKSTRLNSSHVSESRMPSSA